MKYQISNIKYQISNKIGNWLASLRSGKLEIGNSPALQERGFTLIELLISIAIISILTSIIMVNFVGIRQRARDSQRKSDIRQIQSALEMYRADQGSYPTAIPTDGCGMPSANHIANVACTSVYMKNVPLDPKGVSYQYNSGKYNYQSDGTSYTISACLENTNDSQGVEVAGSTECAPPLRTFQVENP